MSYKSVFTLGRQPAIGRAEIESLLGADHLAPLGEHGLVSDIEPDVINFARIGSATRLGRVLTEFDTTNWIDISRLLEQKLPHILRSLPETGKVKLGVSAFGLSVGTKQLFRTGLELKKVCKQAGRSVRLVPNTEVALSSAQVLHNSLVGEVGIELLLISSGKKTLLAQTVAVQDITAYAKRDQNRPKRDAFVGMLPPKLAQTIINLAAAQTNPRHGSVILDPFCGTGVVLQEATLMGFDVYGSDLNPRMIEYTDQNLMWLLDQPGTHVKRPANTAGDPDWRYFRLEVGDATTHQWRPAPNIVACETYLGHPLANWPRPEKLQEIIGTCNVITEKFMKNIAAQIPAGTRLCLAVPAWINPNGAIHHLPALDHLEKMGYNRVSFMHAREAELVYHRSDQIVARELLVITRK